MRREKVETTVNVLFTFTATGKILSAPAGARALLPAFLDEWQARVPALHPGTTRSRCYAAPLLSFRARRSAGTPARQAIVVCSGLGKNTAGKSARAPNSSRQARRYVGSAVGACIARVPRGVGSSFAMTDAFRPKSEMRPGQSFRCGARAWTNLPRSLGVWARMAAKALWAEPKPVRARLI